MSCQSAEKVKEINGAALYKAYCVNCHGIDGSLKTNGAIDLRYSVLTLEERVLVISEGRNVMTSFRNTLNAQQIQAVAEYTFHLRDQLPNAK